MSFSGMDVIKVTLATFSWAASWQIFKHVSAGPENIFLHPQVHRNYISVLQME